jgi:tetratricopeptide (TPR) repeat protein
MPKATKAKSGGLATILKWVGGTTAVLSLVFGLRQLTILITDARSRQRQITELIATGKLQQEARDYGAAWKSLGKAAELRGTDSKVRAAQEDLAMAWLDDLRGDQGPAPFSATVDMVVPVISRGAVAAAGSRKADLLAHLGWADFLRWRDGQRGLEPAERYRQALAVDSQNVYAHAMLAHWMLWNGGNLEDANRHFAAARRSGRERPYVRRLQLAALANARNGAGDLEMLRVASDMRKNNEPMDLDDRGRIWDTYYARFISSPAEDSIEPLFAAVPPAEQVATYRWVFENTGYVESKGFLYEYLLARLQDAAGQDAEALATYRSVRSKIPANVRDRIRGSVDSAIVRLTKRP